MHTLSDPRDDRSVSLADWRQIDDLCREFENSWQAGQRPTIEEILPADEERIRRALLRELLAIEMLYADTTDAETVSALGRRFPDERDLIELVAQELAEVRRTPPFFRHHPRYRVLRLLEEDGGSRLYLAKHLQQGRQVLLQVLPPALAGAALADFLSQAHALARLRHPQLPRVGEVHRESPTFLVMELCNGVDLHALVEADGPLPSDAACDLALQVLAALQAAHEGGVRGWSLTPRDVRLQGDGLVKLCCLKPPVVGETAPACGCQAAEQQSKTKSCGSGELQAVATLLHFLITGKTAASDSGEPELSTEVAAVVDGLRRGTFASLREAQWALAPLGSGLIAVPADEQAAEAILQERITAETERTGAVNGSELASDGMAVRTMPSGGNGAGPAALLPPEHDRSTLDRPVSPVAEGTPVATAGDAPLVDSEVRPVPSTAPQAAGLAHEDTVAPRPKRRRLALAGLSLAGMIALGAWGRTTFTSTSQVAPHQDQDVERMRAALASSDAAATTATIATLEGILRRSPRDGVAWTALGEARLRSVLHHGGPIDQMFASAQEAAEQAIAVDSTYSGAHLTLALVHHRYLADWPTAEKEYAEALALDPDCAAVHHAYAWFLAHHGDFDQAAAEIEQAIDLAPHDLHLLNEQGRLLYLAREYASAVARHHYVLSLDPPTDEAHATATGEAHWGLVFPLIELGSFREALQACEAAERAGFDPIQLATARAYLLARQGEAAAARNVLHAAAKLTDPLALAAVHAALDEPGPALDRLEQAFQQQWPTRADILIDPRFDRLRAAARFQALVRAIEPPEPPVLEPTDADAPEPADAVPADAVP